MILSIGRAVSEWLLQMTQGHSTNSMDLTGADKGKSPPEPQTHEISAADIARGGKKGLIKLLKLDGDSEWREWLQLDFVKPYWLELWQHLSKVGDTERGTGLARVQETLIRGEARGNTKYSRRHVDKTNWDINDHMAYFLYNVRTENLSRRDGVFHRLGLHTGEMEAAVWALKNILVKCTVPRRSRSQAVGLRFSV